MSASVIIYGPKGCGKTINAARIRDHFGLTLVIDCDKEPGNMLRRLSPIADGVLYLTNVKPKENFRCIRMVEFKDLTIEGLK